MTDRKFYNHRGFMVHRIVLSNGRALLIEEDNNCLHIADSSEVMEGEANPFFYIHSYICEINANGVLVMPNSGEAVNCVTSELQKNLQDIDGVGVDLG